MALTDHHLTFVLQPVTVCVSAHIGDKAQASGEPITQSLTHTPLLPLREQCLRESYSNEHTAASFCQNRAQDKGTNTHPVDKPRAQETQKHTRT